MDFTEQNNLTRNYFKQDFSPISELLLKVRNSLITGNVLRLDNVCLDGLIDFKSEKQFFYISIFQEFTDKIRFGSKRATLEETLNRIISKLREHPRFNEFEISNPDKTRILFEFITEKTRAEVKKIHISGKFDSNRFEPGISGLELVCNKSSYIFLPTDSPVLNYMTLNPVLANLADKTGLVKGKKLKEREKAEFIKNLEGAEFYLLKSIAFVTYKTNVLPLYRGNVIYEDFDWQTVLSIIKTSNDRLIADMPGDGKFMYYYNPTKDDNIDHEHPTRRPPDLYYNDLRHAGAAISLIRAYELTLDKKYLDAAKSAINWTIEQTRFHKDENGNEAAYVWANQKAKLGGVGVPLIMLMKYRMNTGDKTYDRYIESYSRHILSRLTADGEFMGYYIHPSYHNGEPLLDMTDKERKETFSFYYPGEALMGLGLVANNYKENNELVSEIIKKTKKAMRWIIDKRPVLYKDLFTALPSDAWLMQAIEECAKCKGFLEKNDIDFVFNDARVMTEKMYTRDDSPYIDFEGGMYYEYGDHYYPDGARCEGLIAAYWLAKYLDKNELADKILYYAKKAAKCQFQLFISKYNNYAHRNPKKSENSIKFKSTRQWTRVDSIQHVACFFARLYLTENKIGSLNFKSDIKIDS